MGTRQTTSKSNTGFWADLRLDCNIMNELVAVLCVAFLAGGWIIFMIGRKNGRNPNMVRIY